MQQSACRYSNLCERPSRQFNRMFVCKLAQNLGDLRRRDQLRIASGQGQYHPVSVTGIARRPFGRPGFRRSEMQNSKVRRRLNIAENHRTATNAFRCLSLLFEGIPAMSMRPKIRLGSFATRAVLVLAILRLACASISHAQFIDFACMPDNSLQTDKEGLIYMDPVVWAPGHSYTVTITGTFPIAVNCTDTEVSVSAWEWPDAPDWWEIGPGANYINLSNLTWVSATQTTFDVSVDGGAPSGNLFFELASVPGFENYWQVAIQPPPPPNPPSPPPGPQLPCPNPMLDPDNPVTPDTWIPGKTYQITIKGTGFTS